MDYIINPFSTPKMIPVQFQVICPHIYRECDAKNLFGKMIKYNNSYYYRKTWAKDWMSFVSSIYIIYKKTLMMKD